MSRELIDDDGSPYSSVIDDLEDAFGVLWTWMLDSRQWVVDAARIEFSANSVAAAASTMLIIMFSAVLIDGLDMKFGNNAWK